MGTRRVRSAVQASFNVAQGSVREPHRECAEEEDTPPSSSLLSSWPALGEERGQLTASSPFPLPSRPFVYGGELPKKGERWSAIEAVPFAAAQQWGGMGDTLMTTEKASLAFSIPKRSCLEVRVRLRSRSSLE